MFLSLFDLIDRENTSLSRQITQSHDLELYDLTAMESKVAASQEGFKQRPWIPPASFPIALPLPPTSTSTHDRWWHPPPSSSVCMEGIHHQLVPSGPPIHILRGEPSVQPPPAPPPIPPCSNYYHSTTALQPPPPPLPPTVAYFPYPQVAPYLPAPPSWH